MSPSLTDPVVIDGTKYRIRSIEEGRAELRTSFRPRPGADFLRSQAEVDQLVWDRVAGVWRLKA